MLEADPENPMERRTRVTEGAREPIQIRGTRRQKRAPEAAY